MMKIHTSLFITALFVIAKKIKKNLTKWQTMDWLNRL